MVTSKGDEHLAVEAMKKGAVDYIPKDAFAEHNLVQAFQQLSLI